MKSPSSASSGAKESSLLTRFRAGSSVVVAGLQTSSELNGKIGTVGKYDSNSKRWEINVHGVGFKKIRAENLQLIPPLPRKRRLCKFGQQCYRPDCWFTHTDEGARRAHFANIWRQGLGPDEIGNDRADLEEMCSSASLEKHFAPTVKLAQSPSADSQGTDGVVSSFSYADCDSSLSAFVSAHQLDAELYKRTSVIESRLEELAQRVADTKVVFKSSQAIQSKCSGQQTAEHAPKLTDTADLHADITSIVASEVRKIMMPTMEAAFTPLVTTLVERMVAIERMVDISNYQHVLNSPTCSEAELELDT